MPRVICRSPNASTSISGVSFEPHPDGGMISAEIDEAQAKRFASIPGYEIVAEEDKAAAKKAAAEKAAADKAAAEKAAAEQAAADKEAAEKAAADNAASAKPSSPAASKKGDDKAAK